MPLDMRNRDGILPHNQDAEQGLLGCLLIRNAALDDIAYMRPEHFYMPAHQRIFQAIINHVSGSRNASPVTLKNYFEKDEDLKEVGGAQYLADLAGSVVSTLNVPHYAQQILELYTRRGLIAMAGDIIQKSNNFEETPSDPKAILSFAEAALTALAVNRACSSFTAGQAASAAMEWMEGVRDGTISPLTTGYAVLDDKIGGLHGGRLYIVAGRPGMGKTALGINIADNVAATHPALFISLEMPAAEISNRMIATRTGIDVQKQISNTYLTPEEWSSIKGARAEMMQRKFTIEDSAGIDVYEIASLARRHKRKHGKFLLVIDYLGLVLSDRGIQNKVHQIEEITASLKRLAKELDIPIMLLCQLSRAVEAREDKRPNLSDLRDSGAIEQDADVVLFCYREEYYAEREPPQKKANMSSDQHNIKYAAWQADLAEIRGKAEIIIAKNRQGRTGIVPMNFNGSRQRFS